MKTNCQETKIAYKSFLKHTEIFERLAQDVRREGDLSAAQQQLTELRSSTDALRERIDQVYLAEKIMGNNFLGMDLLEEIFEPSPEIVQELRHVPFLRETLESCKDTRVLFPHPGFSIANGKSNFGSDNLSISNNLDAEHGHLTNAPSFVTWHLVRKNVLPETLDKNLEEQLTLVPTDSQFCSTNTLYFLFSLFFEKTGVNFIPPYDTLIIRT